ncbi:hypothetical protein HNS38_05130 [Lentimicrobium sp. L6]|uniref:hypothetical protein n=1 Tax=Lentimicrobium sp. L6 TaxID=2735916 RepID=UPI00155704D0|nr:hypothetical protein [Lentimicrobium sp. L6]NPD84130.1 hypothetical protein [Lentimicrobium sp. L6]
MKQSKKNILSVLALSIVLLFSGITFAQAPKGDGPQKPPVPNEKQVKKMVNELAEELELSDKQETEILAVYQSHFNEVKDKTSGKEKPKKEEMDALKSSFEKEVKALLSEEQQSKYKTYIKKQEHRKPKRK